MTLTGGGFIVQQRNAVLVGGTGTGKSHLAIAIARACIRNGARGRFYIAVDLVNRLETEARGGRQGRLAEYLTRMDFVVLDELGYLAFSQAGGQLLFPDEPAYERTWFCPSRLRYWQPDNARRGPRRRKAVRWRCRRLATGGETAVALLLLFWSRCHMPTGIGYSLLDSCPQHGVAALAQPSFEAIIVILI